MAAHVQRVRHLKHASRLCLRGKAGWLPYTTVGVKVSLGCREGGGGAGRGLIDRVDEKVESAGMSGAGYENLLLQGCRKAHVGAAVS